MVAAVLLAASTIGIAGAMSASYQHDVYSAQQRAAIRSGRQLLDEVAALPLSPANAGEASMLDFVNYTDTAISDASGSVVHTVATATSNTTSGSSGSGSTSSSSSSGSSSSGSLLGGIVDPVTSLLVGGSSGSSSSGSGSGSSGSGSGGSGSSSSSSSSSSTAASSTMSGTSALRVARAITIERRNSLTGAVDAAGDLALIDVRVTTASGRTVRMRRLVSSAEGQANTTTANAN